MMDNISNLSKFSPMWAVGNKIEMYRIIFEMLLVMYYEKSTHFMYLILNLCYVQIYPGRLYREYNRAVG